MYAAITSGCHHSSLSTLPILHTYHRYPPLSATMAPGIINTESSSDVIPATATTTQKSAHTVTPHVSHPLDPLTPDEVHIY